MSQAAARALGLFDANSDNRDGNFDFDQAATFDYDNSDGITAGAFDFEYIFMHELGHLLGFASGVDDRSKEIAILDLARFADADCPGSAGAFDNSSDRTGGKKKQSVDCDTCLPGWSLTMDMSTGSKNGDGRQASHWKDDKLSGTWLGLMDPSISTGANFSTTSSLYVTTADVRAWDFIGWDFELSTLYPGTFQLTDPPDYATHVGLTPTLNWTPASDATSYRVRVFHNMTFVVDGSVFSSSHTIPPSALAPDTNYTWYVLAQNSFGSQMSDVWHFTTQSGQGWFSPEPLILLAPLSGGPPKPRQPIMNWEQNEQNPILTYILEIDDESGFQSPRIFRTSLPLGGGAPPYTLPARILRNNSTYFWRVVAMNGDGVTFSPSSGGESFTTGVFPPDTFGLLSPGAGVDEVSVRTAFTWQPAWEATSYTLQVDDDPAFGSPILNVSGLTTNGLEPLSPPYLLPNTNVLLACAGPQFRRDDALGSCLAEFNDHRYAPRRVCPPPASGSGAAPHDGSGLAVDDGDRGRRVPRGY